jgi:hypothetical protein
LSFTDESGVKPNETPGLNATILSVPCSNGFRKSVAVFGFRSLARKAWRYIEYYSRGFEGQSVVLIYKSHRRLLESLELE